MKSPKRPRRLRTGRGPALREARPRRSHSRSGILAGNRQPAGRPVAESEPAPAPAAVAQAAPAGASAFSRSMLKKPRRCQPAQAEPRAVGTSGQADELPRTASPLMLSGLLGLLSLAGAAGLRLSRS